MSNDKIMNRGWVVIGAILIQLCLGAIYAWSVFTPALTASDAADVAAIYSPKRLGLTDEQHKAMKAELSAPKKILSEAGKVLTAARKDATNPLTAQAAETAYAAIEKAQQSAMDAVSAAHGVKDTVDSLKFSMSKTQSQGVFAAGLAAFAVIMVIAGRLMPKIGPTKLAISGGLVLGVGYALAGLIDVGSFWSTFVFVGLVGGSGIGLAYVVPIAIGIKWFPDRKGLITGLAVAGFGFGALLWVKLAGQWGALIAGYGLGTTFVAYGVVFALMCLIGAIWMKNPPQGWQPAGYQAPGTAGASGKIAPSAGDLTSSQMLKTPQFYLIFLCFVFGAGAGLMSIGLMKLFPKQALEANNVAGASAIAGTAMAVFFSLANGLGRIIWGVLSDKLGRKLSIFLMLATQGVLVICFQWMAGTPALLYLGAALIGFNFGGNFALFPTMTADTFGAKHIGQNYGWVFLAYGVGGIGGPLLGGRLGDLGNFPLAFTICGVAVLAAAVLAIFIRHPKPAAL